MSRMVICWWRLALQDMERECTRAKEELASVLSNQESLTTQAQGLSQVRHLSPSVYAPIDNSSACTRKML